MQRGARSLVLGALCLFSLACEKSSPRTDVRAGDPSRQVDVERQVMTQLEKRSKHLVDFSYRGVIENEDASETLHFSFWFQQPGKMKATLHEAALTYVFDGTWLSVVDHNKKRLLKQDLSVEDDGAQLLALHELFRQFSTDGWRAPLLRWTDGALQMQEVEERGERFWELLSNLEDEQLAYVRYRFGAPYGDFVRKDFVDKNGDSIASTGVLKATRDPKTSLGFPVEWEQRNAQGLLRVRLSEWQINEGFGANFFSIQAPEGYEVQIMQGESPAHRE